MAYTELTLQQTDRVGAAVSLTAALAGGHAFDNTDEDVLLLVSNGHTASIVVTISTAATVDGLSVADITMTVPASGLYIIGPFPADVYSQGDDDTGLTKAVLVDTDIQTNVTYAAIQMGSLSYE